MFRVVYPCANILSRFTHSQIKLISFSLIAISGLLIAGCSWTNFGFEKSAKKLSPRVVEYGQPVPKGGGVYKIGKPYKVSGQWYRPKVEADYDEVGAASWYGHLFHGRYTANQEVYDMDALTAAHPTLPLPSYVRVTNRNNGRSLVVRVNDRGPYANDRIIDLSRRSAQLLGFEKAGIAPVRVTYLRRAPLNGDDTYERRYLAQQRWMRPRRRYSRWRRKRRYAGQRRRRYDRITTGNISRRRNRYSRNRHKRAGRSVSRKGYIVQAGVYQSRWNADRMKGKISRFGRTFIESHRSRNYPLYRVMLGPYRNRYQALKAADRIAKVGIYDAIVVRN